MYKNIKRINQQKTGNHCVLFLVIFIFVILITSFVMINQRETMDKSLQMPQSTVYNNGNQDNGLTNTTSNETPDSSLNNTKNNDKDESHWCLVLVNKWNPMVGCNNIEITKLSNGERVDTRIYPYLQEMFDAARNSGVYPIVASGYRTAKEQQEIYDNRVEEYKAEGLSAADANRETEYWVAVPGTSEHQLGLAVDINADEKHSKSSEVYDWLKENAHLYGFINRYPADKVDITGVANEPWHYRYVGVEAATEIYNRNICFEEYLGKAN